MKHFLKIFLLLFFAVATNSFASEYTDAPLERVIEYSSQRKDGSMVPGKSLWIETLVPTRISEFEDHPLFPGFKDLTVGVPKLEATATEIAKLDSLIETFDPATFSLPWYDKNKVGYPVLLRLPDGPVTGSAVLLHGADGVADIDFIIANKLSSSGKAVAIPILFGAHGVTKGGVAKNQMAIPLEQTVIAAYRFLHFLKSHPDMADKEVSLLGRSRSAMVADLCARTFYQRHISPTLQFNRFIMIDGFVLRNEVDPSYTGAPMLFMHGALDNWTPLSFVKRHVDVLKAKGYPVALEVFEGGHHAFLEPASPEGKGTIEKEVQTFNNCTFIDNGPAGFTPLIYDPTAEILTSGSQKTWDEFIPFIMANMVENDKIMVGASGEHTEKGLSMIEAFLSGAASGK
ncbi:MAG: dienelactone hydrolase family protein [Alphaproteobacteria bacterium]|nr:dienelactone hydrolase family protein [Alphaproteobacteria bacterium]